MKKGLIIISVQIQYRRISQLSALAIAFLFAPSLIAEPVSTNFSVPSAPADPWAATAPVSAIHQAPLSALNVIENAPPTAISENKTAESPDVAANSDDKETKPKPNQSQPAAPPSSPGDDLLPGLIPLKIGDQFSEDYPLARAAEIEVRFTVAEAGTCPCVRSRRSTAQ